MDTQPTPTALAPPAPLADQVYNRVRSSIAAGRITVAGATIMLTAAMAEAERIRTLSGLQKKALVLHVVDRLVGEIPVGQEDREAIQAATALLLPSMIDALVAAGEGKLGIGHRACCGLV